MKASMIAVGLGRASAAGRRGDRADRRQRGRRAADAGRSGGRLDRRLAGQGPLRPDPGRGHTVKAPAELQRRPARQARPAGRPTKDGMQLIGADGQPVIAFHRWSNSLFVSHRSSGVDIQLRRGGPRGLGSRGSCRGRRRWPRAPTPGGFTRARQVGQVGLQVDGAVGADQEALAPAAADQAERRVGRAVDLDARRRWARPAAMAAHEALRAAAGSAPETITAASRPNGGRPAASRSAISAATKASRSWAASACITGCSGAQVCSSARPGRSLRPARPAAWASSWKVRSAARRSPPRRPRSASTTPTRVRFGKLWPLAAAWVATRMSISPVGHGLDQPRARLARVEDGVGGEDRDARLGEQARAPPPPPARRPGPMETRLSLAPQCGQALGLGHGKAGQVADQPAGVAVLDQPGVGVRRGHPLAAGPAEHQRRIAPAVEEQQGLLAPREGLAHGLRPAAATASGRARAASRAGRSARCPAARASPWRAASRSQR